MKGTIKIIAMLLIVMTVAMVSAPVFAFDPTGFLDKVSNGTMDANAENKMSDIAGNILAIVRNLAIVIGVIMISILGIKYMVGSAEEKASYKKTLIPLVVGIVLVVAATSLITMVIGFANGLN